MGHQRFEGNPMTHKHAALAIAIAALLSAPAFAQSPAGTSAGVSASANANTSVTVTPSTSVAVPTANLLPGGVMAPAGSTTVLGGPSGDASGTQTVTTR